MTKLKNIATRAVKSVLSEGETHSHIIGRNRTEPPSVPGRGNRSPKLLSIHRRLFRKGLPAGKVRDVLDIRWRVRDQKTGKEETVPQYVRTGEGIRRAF